MRKKDDAPDIREVVRRRVRQLREQRGWSAQQLTEAMARQGVRMTRSTLANYENGRREYLTLDEAIAMALALDVSLADLVADQNMRGAVAIGEAGVIDVRLLRTRLAGLAELRESTSALGAVAQLFEDAIEAFQQVESEEHT